MQLVLIYALGAILAAGMAFMGGSGTPVFAFWLYIIGAVAFAIAAAGQFFKLRQGR